MGFGSDPLGSGPFGLDIATTTAERVAATPAALQLDGLTRDFALDSAGRFVAAHPVDAKVFNRLRILTGSMRSAPDTGNGVGGTYIDPVKIESEVRDQVSLALADMISAREIADSGLAIDLSIKGRVAYEYTYVNLKSGKPGSFRSA